MSQLTYKTFAIAGATGYLGKYLLKAFADIGVYPLILTRKTSNTDSIPPSFKIARVDLNNADEVSQVLEQHGIEVVISLVSGKKPDEDQKGLADGAKRAGVKLLVPAEFGGISDGARLAPEAIPENPLVQKDKFAEYLKSIGLPYARFFNGAFASYAPFLLGGPQPDKANIIIGTDDVEFAVTAEEDVSGFVAHVLTTLSPEDLANRSFRISGEDISFAELAKRIGKEVAHCEKLVAPDPGSEALGNAYTSGKGVSSWDYALDGRREDSSANDNHLWKGHEWKKVAKV
ncbi:hypothetical protein VNI00_011221 [Paramarasmius palmivorus]|uniref:NmrA-like domain-containing protein n=1 Tax=Paramarasmius palmivorus TaxID=297713 RepID=A0AAW0CE54_9AGAR